MNSYTDAQITAWLRGLLAIAWADGDFSTTERTAILEFTQTELGRKIEFDTLTAISADELAANLGKNTPIAENFLRMAMMVAVADGVYSPPEAKMLREFHQALEVDTQVLDTLANTLTPVGTASTGEPNQLQSYGEMAHQHDLLSPVREWLDGLEIDDPRLARLLCKFIPAQCPFERDIILFGHKVVHIPPLCKLNPLFDQTVGLRFRALSYLADKCGEDVSAYVGSTG
jgi:tellurite resistance protein